MIIGGLQCHCRWPLLAFLSCQLSPSSSRRPPWRKTRSSCSTYRSLERRFSQSGHEQSTSDEKNFEQLVNIKVLHHHCLYCDPCDVTSFCLFASDIFCSSIVIEEYSFSTAAPCTFSCLFKFSAASSCVCRLELRNTRTIWWLWRCLEYSAWPGKSFSGQLFVSLLKGKLCSPVPVISKVHCLIFLFL